jgi:hypothetical protein
MTLTLTKICILIAFVLFLGAALILSGLITTPVATAQALIAWAFVSVSVAFLAKPN